MLSDDAAAAAARQSYADWALWPKCTGVDALGTTRWCNDEMRMLREMARIVRKVRDVERFFARTVAANGAWRTVSTTTPAAAAQRRRGSDGGICRAAV